MQCNTRFLCREFTSSMCSRPCSFIFSHHFCRSSTGFNKTKFKCMQSYDQQNFKSSPLTKNKDRTHDNQNSHDLIYDGTGHKARRVLSRHFEYKVKDRMRKRNTEQSIKTWMGCNEELNYFTIRAPGKIHSWQRRLLLLSLHFKM